MVKPLKRLDWALSRVKSLHVPQMPHDEGPTTNSLCHGLKNRDVTTKHLTNPIVMLLCMYINYI